MHACMLGADYLYDVLLTGIALLMAYKLTNWRALQLADGFVATARCHSAGSRRRPRHAELPSQDATSWSHGVTALSGGWFSGPRSKQRSVPLLGVFKPRVSACLKMSAGVPRPEPQVSAEAEPCRCNPHGGQQMCIREVRQGTSLSFLLFQVTARERLQWEVHELESSPVMTVTESEVNLDALCFGDATTWAAGGGSRVNQKLDGLRWAALRDIAVEFDHRYLRVHDTGPLLDFCCTMTSSVSHRCRAHCPAHHVLASG